MQVLILCSIPGVFSIIVRDPPPLPTDYKYSYDITDPYTGDSKSQHEVRQGDLVSGAYTVVGPDGTKRIVEYTADSKHGFQAVIREEPVVKLPEPMTTKLPYVSQSKFYTKPVYTLEGAKLPLQYPSDSDIAFFTPENEIVKEPFPFEAGKYFKPAE